IRGYIQDQSKTIEFNPSTDSDDLKSRNLTWYGTRDLRGSSLANSFARYNFLNTDEAVLLAQNPKVDFDELLSRVVAGPQAAELWSHINKLINPLETEISKTQIKLQRLAAEKATAQEQIANSGASPNQADHAFLALCEDLRRLEWKSEFDKFSIETKVLPNLQRAYSLVREILDADWTEGAVVPRAIGKQRDDERHRVASLRDFVGKISEVRKKIFEIETTLQSHSQRLNFIDEIEQILSSEVLDVIRAIKDEEAQLICERKLITEVSLLSDIQNFVETKNTKVSIDEDLNVVIEKEQQLFAEIQQVSISLERLRQTKSSNQVLLQDIRHLARRLIDQQHNIKHCPVCRSEFDEIELRRRIEKSVESSADEALEIMAKQFDDLTNKQMHLKSKKTLLDDAKRYARNKGFDTALIDLQDILKDISDVRARIVSAEERLERSRKQMAALAKAGFSKERVLKLMNQLKVAGINMATSQDLDEERHSVERARKMLEDGFLEEKRTLDELKKKSLFTFKSSVDATQVPTEERMLLITEQRLTAIEKAILSIDYINELLKIDEDASITILSALIKSATEAAEKYVAAFANEQRLGGVEQKARQRISMIDADIDADNQKLKQLRYAHSILNEIRAKDSLEKDTESELQAVSQVTEAIFSNIHCPREYGVQRELERPLFKLNNKRGVSLKEVSTGQRAAFVLSLFLAMNAKLQTAPKVLLFDDPIAHVDDLNSLSFLDHLRHLVLTGRRQIFYATADARLAGLIEHKFGFLGSAFKRIDLTR
ncbi:MAG: hypothetical protein H0X02_09795, partial [Nitrosomonas sp.]|nr:hypothetical protein [Nitrosomonas sp.]